MTSANAVLYNTFLQRLDGASSAIELQSCLEFAAISLGFDCFLYCGYEYECFTQKRTNIISNFPDAFFNDEIMALGIDKNPTLIACKLSGDAVVWDKALFSKDLAYKRAVQAAGLSVGWGVMTMHSPSKMGFLELARQKGGLSSEEQRLKLSTFRAIIDTFEHHQSDLKRQAIALRMIAGEQSLTSSCPLSSRELEILRWTADGKIADEIGNILNISPRTVNFHLANVMHVLSVPNKTAAISRAQMNAWLY